VELGTENGKAKASKAKASKALVGRLVIRWKPEMTNRVTALSLVIEV
jgi:hypothetical protein